MECGLYPSFEADFSRLNPVKAGLGAGWFKFFELIGLIKRSETPKYLATLRPIS